MPMVPDVLLQGSAESPLRSVSAREPSVQARPPSDQHSSFASVYQRECEDRAVVGRERDGDMPSEQADDAGAQAPVDEQEGAQPTVVAESGNTLPAEMTEQPLTDDMLPLDASQLLSLLPLVASATAETDLTTAEPDLPPLSEEDSAAEQEALIGLLNLAQQSSSSVLPSPSDQPLPDAPLAPATALFESVGAPRASKATPGAALPPGLASIDAGEVKSLNPDGAAPAAVDPELQSADALTALVGSLREKADSGLVGSMPATLTADEQAGKLTQFNQLITQHARNAQMPVLPAAPLAILHGGMSESLVERVMWLSSQNLKSAQIQLEPAELGRLDVRISLFQDQTQVSFASASAAVREALETQSFRLRELFAQQGMTQLDVNVSDQSLQRGWHGGEQEQSRGRTVAEVSVESDSVLNAVQMDLRTVASGQASGLVDFYA